jgi:hypothetical protein
MATAANSEVEAASAGQRRSPEARGSNGSSQQAAHTVLHAEQARMGLVLASAISALMPKPKNKQAKAV